MDFGVYNIKKTKKYNYVAKEFITWGWCLTLTRWQRSYHTYLSLISRSIDLGEITKANYDRKSFKISNKII